MNVLFILHAEWEMPGVIETWAREREFSVSFCRPFQGEKIPSASNFDWFILMGGPQSALNIEQLPYLQAEKELVKDAIFQNKFLLGFCLGAQIIGEAFGASAERSPHREVGIFPITLTEAGVADPLFEGFPKEFSVVHWHADMPGISRDAQILATSEGCPRQVIRYSEKAYGFQCHLEPTLEIMQNMTLQCAGDLIPDKYIQSKEEMLQADYSTINEYMRKFLNHFFDRANANSIINSPSL
ncbi:MAG: homoserine O-succinyltransferase [Simkaniaceae bacterium]|nr:homoserine O-succinyltransferase [Simkaniaceae bacterium]